MAQRRRPLASIGQSFSLDQRINERASEQEYRQLLHGESCAHRYIREIPPEAVTIFRTSLTLLTPALDITPTAAASDASGGDS